MYRSHYVTANRPISEIPQCIRQLSHNVPFCNRNMHTCAHFCYKMMHCGVFVLGTAGFLKWFYYDMILLTSWQLQKCAIIWTNAGIWLIGSLGTNFSQILIEIYVFSFNKMHLKLSSGNGRPFYLSLNVLIEYSFVLYPVLKHWGYHSCPKPTKWPLFWPLLSHIYQQVTLYSANTNQWLDVTVWYQYCSLQSYTKPLKWSSFFFSSFWSSLSYICFVFFVCVCWEIVYIKKKMYFCFFKIIRCIKSWLWLDTNWSWMATAVVVLLNSIVPNVGYCGQHLQ